MPTAGLSQIHMDPENPVPGIGDGMIRELPDEAIDAWVGVAGVDSGSPLLLSEIRQVGGALGREAENGGALSKLDADWAMYSVGMPMTPELGEAIPAHLDRIEEAMEPWGADGAYFNFSERPKHVDDILPPTSATASARSRRGGTPTAGSSPTTRWNSPAEPRHQGTISDVHLLLGGKLEPRQQRPKGRRAPWSRPLGNEIGDRCSRPASMSSGVASGDRLRGRPNPGAVEGTP